MSAAVHTATMPGAARAAAMSTRPQHAQWHRASARCACAAGAESRYRRRRRPRPVSSGGSSSRATDWPRTRFDEREVERGSLHRRTIADAAARVRIDAGDGQGGSGGDVGDKVCPKSAGDPGILRLCRQAGPWVFLTGHEAYDWRTAGSAKRSRAPPATRSSAIAARAAGRRNSSSTECAACSRNSAAVSRTVSGSTSTTRTRGQSPPITSPGTTPSESTSRRAPRSSWSAASAAARRYRPR